MLLLLHMWLFSLGYSSKKVRSDLPMDTNSPTLQLGSFGGMMAGDLLVFINSWPASMINCVSLQFWLLCLGLPGFPNCHRIMSEDLTVGGWGEDRNLRKTVVFRG